MPTITFDCDGVLLDWEAGFADWMRATHEVLLDPEGPKDYDLTQWVGCDAISMIRYVREFNRSEHFARLVPLPGAVSAIQRLRASDYTLRVLTAAGNDPKVKAARVWNLRQRFSTHSFERVECVDLGESKARLLDQLPKGSFYVEDNYGHALDATSLGLRTFMVRCGHNRAQEAACRSSEITWCDDLLEVANRIATLVELEAAQ